MEETGSNTHTPSRLFCKAVSGGGAGELLRRLRDAPAVHVLVEGELVLTHPLPVCLRQACAFRRALAINQQAPSLS
jgi:hypothetical protein